MDINENSNRLAAVEAILADFSIKMQELRESQAETDKQLRQSQAETAKSQVETDRQFKQLQAETAKLQAETDKQFKQLQAETAKSQAETGKQLRILTEQVTGISKSNGLFAEDYFHNSFKIDDLNFFGEHFDKVIRGKGTIVNDEYDFVLINGKTAGIVEVKYKARKDDIEKALKKPDTFRINFPEYQNHKIYLAIAALSITETLENECKKQGLAVIKQNGDKIIVYDKNLKTF